MDFQAFKRILTAFADDPGNIEFANGNLLVQVRDEIIEAKLSQQDDVLKVEENGDVQTARYWIINRVARLPQLADRICSNVTPLEYFVAPSGALLGPEDFTSSADGSQESDIAAAIASKLGQQIPGMTSVWYLTSDAGEGKTSLINYLAVSQARAYKQKRAKWLLVPIPLGGRTFLRFDDVVVAALVNVLRFQLLYYDAFLELVRLGVIVPAFDGFEEMIIEGSSGEAISALGQLVRNLDSAGTVLVAARKAYFDYLSFRSQARLFDAIGRNDVAFGRVSLARWSRQHFVEYAEKRGIQDPGYLFESVVGSLHKEDHPLVARAVLVRRLVEVAIASGPDLADLLGLIGSRPQDYFYQFVHTIVEREANVKWMDKAGDPPQPLLTLEEHHELLSIVAQEMWLSSVDELKTEEVEFVSDIFAENTGKTATVTRQIRERLKQHALIVRSKGGRALAFDHEDFRVFYLGEALGRVLVAADEGALKALLDMASLPRGAVDQAAFHVDRADCDTGEVVELLQRIAVPQLPTSFIRENCSAVILAVADVARRGWEVTRMNLPEDALRGRSLRGLTVSESYFAPTSMAETQLVECRFVRCHFGRLDGAPLQVEASRFESCEIDSLVYTDEDGNTVEAYAPEEVRRKLRDCGFVFDDDKEATSADGRVPTDQLSEDLKLVQRAFRSFLRATRVNESTFRMRLGVKARRFSHDILPQLLDAGILKEVRYEGRGQQRRFRVAVPMQQIEDVMRASGGDFERFVQSFR